MVNIKELRERYQLTRNQFADLFCVPYRTVQSWELGLRSCPLYVFRMMEELLEVYRLSGALESFRKGDNNGKDMP
jgi:DNA-binding transcriptional regulator YiaG